MTYQPSSINICVFIDIKRRAIENPFLFLAENQVLEIPATIGMTIINQFYLWVMNLMHTDLQRYIHGTSDALDDGIPALEAKIIIRCFGTK
ncbi:uncharacterized protein METZ01_LOCUS130704 [marine metagenome]|uniref:Uncharacterized protein n=1 Tax=marine metagenome TaxID=408172 RepID=A0A381YLJ1_9ZZZZ